MELEIEKRLRLYVDSQLDKIAEECTIYGESPKAETKRSSGIKAFLAKQKQSLIPISTFEM